MKDREVQIMMYLDGALNGDELVEFEKVLRSDAVLKAEVDEMKSLNEYTKKRIDLNNALSVANDIHEEYKESSTSIDNTKDTIALTDQKSVKQKWSWLTILVCIVLLLFIFYMSYQIFAPDRPTSQELYASYFEPEVVSFQTKGDPSLDELIKAQIYFNNKEYDLSIEAFQSFESSQNMTLDHRYYYALALIGDGRHEDGRSVLVPMSESNTPYTYEATYFLALSYLQQGNDEKAIEYLRSIPVSASKYNLAQEIIELLEQ